MNKIDSASRYLRKLERFIGIPLASTTSTTRKGLGLENIEEVLRVSPQEDDTQAARCAAGSAADRIAELPSNESTTQVRRELRP